MRRRGQMRGWMLLSGLLALALGGCAGAVDVAAATDRPTHGDAGVPGDPAPPAAGRFALGPGAGLSTGSGPTALRLVGARDFATIRRRVAAGEIPRPEELDGAAFLASHDLPLPPPTCGDAVCLQAQVGPGAGLGAARAVAQIGLTTARVSRDAERPPLNLALALDVSGAEGARWLEPIRAAVAALVGGLRDGDRFALVGAGAPLAMADMTPQRSRLVEAARGIAVGRTGALRDTIGAACREVLGVYDGHRQNRVIVLSTSAGGVTVGELAAATGRYARDGIGIAAVALGPEAGAGPLRALAEQGGGAFHAPADAAGLTAALEGELGGFAIPLAYDLAVEVEAGAAHDVARAVGSPLWVPTTGGGRIELPRALLVHRPPREGGTPGDEARGASLLVELAPRPGDADDPLATVRLQFREPATNRVVSSRLVLARSAASAAGAPAAAKGAVLLRVFAALERAARDFHAGRGGEARDDLRLARAAARALDAATPDPVLAEDAALLERVEGLLAAGR